MGKRIIVAAGGTAGHINPAASLIEYMLNVDSGTEVMFIGTKKGMEKSLIAGLCVEFRSVNASGFNISSNLFRKIVVYFKFLANLILGFFESVHLIRSFNPGIVLGMGGYVCAPVFLAAVCCRKKIAIHEQNYIPGRLNKFFAKFAHYIFISFEDSGKYFKNTGKQVRAEIIYTGNPLRSAVRKFYKLEPDYEKWQLEKDRRTIVCLGGSLGAEKINNTIIELYMDLRNEADFQILLISGTRFYKQVVNRIKEMRLDTDRLIFKVYPYVFEMEKIYRIADLVISRAGAMTVSELYYTMTPAILIPYPEAIENHQLYNAQYLVKKNMAVIINDKDITPGVLLQEIKDMGMDMPLEDRIRDFNKREITGIKGLKIMADKIMGAPKEVLK